MGFLAKICEKICKVITQHGHRSQGADDDENDNADDSKSITLVYQIICNICQIESILLGCQTNFRIFLLSLLLLMVMLLSLLLLLLLFFLCFSP